MRLTVFILLMLCVTGGCQARRTPKAEPATTRRATSGAASEAAAVFTEYLDAVAAQDRDGLRRLVLLPTDEKRRKWVLDVIGKGELPPPGVKRLSPAVKLEGPVAVARVSYEMPDGSREESPPGFLVGRDGRWRVVVDYFEGGGLTEEEMQVVARHLSGR